MRCGAAAGGAGGAGRAMKGSAIGCCTAGRRSNRIVVHGPKTSVSLDGQREDEKGCGERLTCASR
eukprot:15431855-Alexandrium_andersonii.AAC.1